MEMTQRKASFLAFYLDNMGIYSFMLRALCWKCEMRQLRQTQAITEANATVQVHAASNSTNGESRAKTKGKATEGKKTGSLVGWRREKLPS
jgi:hypothetical protein